MASSHKSSPLGFPGVLGLAVTSLQKTLGRIEPDSEKKLQSGVGGKNKWLVFTSESLKRHKARACISVTLKLRAGVRLEAALPAAPQTFKGLRRCHFPGERQFSDSQTSNSRPFPGLAASPFDIPWPALVLGLL